jgi:hypothetical protein
MKPRARARGLQRRWVVRHPAGLRLAASWELIQPAVSEPFRQDFDFRETYYLPKETGFHCLPGAMPCRPAHPPRKKPHSRSSSFWWWSPSSASSSACSCRPCRPPASRPAEPPARTISSRWAWRPTATSRRESIFPRVAGDHGGPGILMQRSVRSSPEDGRTRSSRLWRRIPYSCWEVMVKSRWRAQPKKPPHR